MQSAHTLLTARALLKLVIEHPEVKILSYVPWDGDMYYIHFVSDDLPVDGYNGVQEISFTENGLRFKRDYDA
jgi:hypothetical protein